MKKIFFSGLLVVGSWLLLTTNNLLLTNNTFAQQDSLVNDFLAKTTIGATDIVPFQITSGGNWYWRKITGANWWAQTRDTIESFSYSSLGASNTFTGINTFNGATFAAGSHGSITFNDSLISPSTAAAYIARYYPYNTTSFIGTSALPIYSIYTKLLYVLNSGGTDSVGISYDGTNIIFDKGIAFDDSTLTLGDKDGTQLRSVTTDSLVGKNGLMLTTNTGTINMNKMVSNAGGRHDVNASTTSLTIDSTFILLNTTNAATIDTLYLDLPGSANYSAFDMLRVTIMNEGAYNVIFTDTAPGSKFTGCMFLAGNDTLNVWDTLELLYYPNQQIWVKLGGSNN